MRSPLGVCVTYTMFTIFASGGTASDPRCSVGITGRPLPLVFGIELVGLFEDPTASVGVISWFIGVAMNLARPIQYFV